MSKRLLSRLHRHSNMAVVFRSSAESNNWSLPSMSDGAERASRQVVQAFWPHNPPLLTSPPVPVQREEAVVSADSTSAVVSGTNGSRRTEPSPPSLFTRLSNRVQRALGREPKSPLAQNQGSTSHRQVSRQASPQPTKATQNIPVSPAPTSLAQRHSEETTQPHIVPIVPQSIPPSATSRAVASPTIQRSPVNQPSAQVIPAWQATPLPQSVTPAVTSSQAAPASAHSSAVMPQQRIQPVSSPTQSIQAQVQRAEAPHQPASPTDTQAGSGSSSSALDREWPRLERIVRAHRRKADALQRQTNPTQVAPPRTTQLENSARVVAPEIEDSVGQVVSPSRQDEQVHASPAPEVRRSAEVPASSQDRHWRRLETISRLHREKKAATQTAPAQRVTLPQGTLPNIQQQGSTFPVPPPQGGASPAPPPPISNASSSNDTGSGQVSNVSGDITVGGSLTTTASNVGGLLNAGSEATIADNTTIDGGGQTGGFSTTQSTIVNGATSANDVMLSGDNTSGQATAGRAMVMRDSTAVAGSVTRGKAPTKGTTQVRGNVQGESIKTQEATEIGGNITTSHLNADGTTNISGNVSATAPHFADNTAVSGNVQASSLKTTGAVQMTGGAEVGGSVNSTGITNIGGSLGVGGNATMSGGVSVGGNVTVGGDATGLPTPSGGGSGGAVQQKRDEDAPSMQPLQAVWPVQQAKNPLQVIQRVPAEKLTAPIERDRQTESQVRSILGSISAEKPTDTGIQLMTPRRPRPRVQRKTGNRQQATTNGKLPIENGQLKIENDVQGVSEINAAQPKHSASGNGVIQRQAPATIQTDVGPLPSDLWQLMGKEPPPSGSIATAMPLVQRSTVPPDVDPNLVIQRAVAIEPITAIVQAPSTPDQGEGGEEGEPNVDTDELARQVYAQLKRRLSAEMERQFRK